MFSTLLYSIAFHVKFFFNKVIKWLEYQQYKQKKYIVAEEHKTDEDITEMGIENSRRKRGTDESIRASGEERKGLIGHDDEIEEESSRYDDTERLTED